MTLEATIGLVCIIIAAFFGVALILFWIVTLTMERNELKKELADLKAKEERRKELEQLKKQFIVAPSKARGKKKSQDFANEDFYIIT